MHERHIRIFFVALVISFIGIANAVNLRQCLENINNITIDGKTDNRGHALPPSTPNATAITYELCVSQCGADQQPFLWSVFSLQFGTWLLPWLALVSQLPFGANDKLGNLESMLLTVGSPTLATYSLALTVLNGRWIAQLFSSYRYPNVQSAMRILSGLQQSPLQVKTDNALLASLVVLPQNEEWWTELVVWLDYTSTSTWSISTATSIAWVIVAYIFTLVDFFSQSLPTSLNAGRQGAGSIGFLWLWLLPVVVGWLQVSPKCDSFRLRQALERANALAYVATPTSAPRKASSLSNNHAISFSLLEYNDARLDEHSTPPIFNYARFLPWVRTVMVVSDTFRNVSERNDHHDPLIPDTDFWDRNINRLATAPQVQEYCRARPESTHTPTHKWGVNASVLSRIFIASILALMLQWGTTGAAVINAWFTPTIGLGCRSASYIAYGVLSTVVWVMLLISSILAHCSTSISTRSYRGRPTAVIWVHVARTLSITLRRLGKSIAAVNAVWVVSTSMLQFGSFYERCYCNSNVLGLGRGAYDVIIATHTDVVNMRAAWNGAFALACGVVAIIVGFVNLFINPPLPS